MARLKKSIDKEVILRAEERFKGLREGKLAMKLRGIIAFGNNSAEEVAQILKISPRSIFRWVVKFKKNDIDGLREKPKGHYKSKLTEERKAQVKEWIRKGRNSRGETIHWTLQKLKLEVYRELGVTISTTALWQNLKKMGLVIRRPRPIHYKADKRQQEDFKKKFKQEVEKFLKKPKTKVFFFDRDYHDT